MPTRGGVGHAVKLRTPHVRLGRRMLDPSGRPKGDTGRALIAVDVQNDFLPRGALGVPHGNEVITPLVEIGRSAKIQTVVASGDWHPEAHISFTAQGGLWPPHAVAGTPGARIDYSVSELADKIVHKGTDVNKDAYSAFQGTDLEKYLREQGIDKVVIGGLATDYCVKATALDAKKAGFKTTVVLSASRGVDVKPGDSERAIAEMKAAGVTIAKDEQALNRLISQGKASPAVVNNLGGFLKFVATDVPRQAGAGLADIGRTVTGHGGGPELGRAQKRADREWAEMTRRLRAGGKETPPLGMVATGVIPSPGQLTMPTLSGARDMANLKKLRADRDKALKAAEMLNTPEALGKFEKADRAWQEYHTRVYGSPEPHRDRMYNRLVPSRPTAPMTVEPEPTVDARVQLARAKALHRTAATHRSIPGGTPLERQRAELAISDREEAEALAIERQYGTRPNRIGRPLYDIGPYGEASRFVGADPRGASAASRRSGRTSRCRIRKAAWHEKRFAARRATTRGRSESLWQRAERPPPRRSPPPRRTPRRRIRWTRRSRTRCRSSLG